MSFIYTNLFFIFIHKRHYIYMEKKKDKEHEHFVNDDPTKFDHEKMEDLAKEALKKFRALK